MNTKVFISGIDTGVGKTIVSAIICKALSADYWKPIQSGSLDFTDTHLVRKLVGVYHPGRFHPEGYAFKHGLSPHAAARLEQTTIQIDDLSVPPSENLLVIEGAGGLMVPLNDQELLIDLIEHLKTPVILVTKNYLGSINHTLLSLSVLKTRGIPVLGIIYTGDKNESSESAIFTFSGIPTLAHIDWSHDINAQFIEEQALKVKAALQNHLQHG